MGNKIDKIIVFVNPTRTGAPEAGEEVRKILADKKIRVTWIDRPLSMEELRDSQGSLSGFPADLIVAIGGDGTLLDAARRTYGSGIPLAGINAGSLGFLSTIAADEVHSALPLILDGHFTVQERGTLALKISRDGGELLSTFALNEIVISRGPHPHMVQLDVIVNGSFLSSYLCDGLIVATPTGSTAYSLSAGGPVLSPMTYAMAITPICAHTLTNRPIVLGPEESIEIIVPSESPILCLQADGLTYCALDPLDRVLLAFGEEKVGLVQLPCRDFYSVLRQKLHWSGRAI